MNDSWGFNITDVKYKSVKQLIHYIVNVAGRNTNFLLNIGPMPNGEIQKEFIDTLAVIGKWMQQYGKSIYGTRGNDVPLQPWGVVTSKDKTMYVHIINKTAEPYIFISSLKQKIASAKILNTGKLFRTNNNPKGFLFIWIMWRWMTLILLFN